MFFHLGNFYFFLSICIPVMLSIPESLKLPCWTLLDFTPSWSLYYIAWKLHQTLLVLVTCSFYLCKSFKVCCLSFFHPFGLNTFFNSRHIKVHEIHLFIHRCPLQSHPSCFPSIPCLFGTWKILWPEKTLALHTQ